MNELVLLPNELNKIGSSGYLEFSNYPVPSANNSWKMEFSKVFKVDPYCFIFDFELIEPARQCAIELWLTHIASPNVRLACGGYKDDATIYINAEKPVRTGYLYGVYPYPRPDDYISPFELSALLTFDYFRVDVDNTAAQELTGPPT